MFLIEKHHLHSVSSRIAIYNVQEVTPLNVHDQWFWKSLTIFIDNADLLSLSIPGHAPNHGLVSVVDHLLIPGPWVTHIHNYKVRLVLLIHGPGPWVTI